jgi:hypothetical protein
MIDACSLTADWDRPGEFLGCFRVQPKDLACGTGGTYVLPIFSANTAFPLNSNIPFAASATDGTPNVNIAPRVSGVYGPENSDVGLV